MQFAGCKIPHHFLSLFVFSTSCLFGCLTYHVFFQSVNMKCLFDQESVGRHVEKTDYAFKREAVSDMKGEVYWKLIPLARSLSSFSFFILLFKTIRFKEKREQEEQTVRNPWDSISIVIFRRQFQFILTHVQLFSPSVKEPVL